MKKTRLGEVRRPPHVGPERTDGSDWLGLKLETHSTDCRKEPSLHSGCWGSHVVNPTAVAVAIMVTAAPAPAMC